MDVEKRITQLEQEVELMRREWVELRAEVLAALSAARGEAA